MTKKISLVCLAASALLVLTSCGSSRYIIPQAASSVKAVSFEELNLTSKDYEVLDRIEISTRLEVSINSDSYTIKDPDGAFLVEFEKNKNGAWELENVEGVVRSGYWSSDVDFSGPSTPSEYAYRMAVYRIINLVKELGGDGIVEPVVSTSVEDNKSSWRETSYTLLTTVSGKVIRLKTSK